MKHFHLKWSFQQISLFYHQTQQLLTIYISKCSIITNSKISEQQIFACTLLNYPDQPKLGQYTCFAYLGSKAVVLAYNS